MADKPMLSFRYESTAIREVQSTMSTTITQRDIFLIDKAVLERGLYAVPSGIGKA